MKSYGQTIRELRQAKGYLQKEIYSDVVAKSFAIRFEKGEVMLHYDSFLEVLSRINVTQEEFHFIHQGYQAKSDNNLWHQFAKAVNTSSNRKLATIYQDYRNSRVVFEKVVAYLANALVVYNEYSAKYFTQHMNQQEIVYLQEYLLARTSWTLDETNIFTSCYFIFEDKIKKILMKNCYKSLRNYREFPSYNERMTNLLANYILHCYDLGDYQEGNQWFVKIQSLPRNQEELSLGLRRDLCEAYYIYTKRDFIQADKLINSYQSALSNAGYSEAAQQASKHFKKFKQAYDATNIRIIR